MYICIIKKNTNIELLEIGCTDKRKRNDETQSFYVWNYLAIFQDWLDDYDLQSSSSNDGKNNKQPIDVRN